MSRVVIGVDVARGDATAMVICRIGDDGLLVFEDVVYDAGRSQREPPPLLRAEYQLDGQHLEIIADNWKAVLEWDLRQRHVGEEIIRRVLRLNRSWSWRGSQPLRGFHRKPGRWWGLPRGLAQKGEIIRREGREVWALIPRGRWVKDGRRVWASYSDIAEAKRRLSL